MKSPNTLCGKANGGEVNAAAIGLALDRVLDHHHSKGAPDTAKPAR